MEERRLHNRVFINLPVKYEIIDVPDSIENIKERTGKGRTINISGNVIKPEEAFLSKRYGGILIETDRPIPLNSKVKMTIEMPVPGLASFISVVTDVVRIENEKTKYKVAFHIKNEDSLFFAQDQLYRKDKLESMSLLAEGIAHEFNNLIGSMYGYAQLAKENPSFVSQCIEIVLQNSERARKLISGLLSFAEISETEQRININSRILNIINLTKKAFEDYHIKINKQLSHVSEIYSKQETIDHLIMTLLTNSREAIVNNGGTGEIIIRTKQIEDKVLLYMEDNGIGISEEDYEKIFDPFFTTKDRYGYGSTHGAGLNLAIVKNRLRKMGASIQVSTTKKNHTLFTVSLPVKDKAKPKHKIKKLLKDNRKKNILIVDDEPEIGRIIKTVLSKYPYNVDHVASGRETLQKCMEIEYDYIFLDLYLTDEFNGFDIFDELEKMGYKAKIIFLTGRILDDKLESYIRKAYGFISKPFSLDRITELIDK